MRRSEMRLKEYLWNLSHFKDHEERQSISQQSVKAPKESNRHKRKKDRKSHQRGRRTQLKARWYEYFIPHSSL